MASLQKIVLTIPSGTTVSNAISINSLRNCRSLSVQAEAAALTGTVSLTSGDDETVATWTIVQSPPGTDVTVTADRSGVLTVVPFPALRLESTTAEASDRVFNVWLSIGE